MVQLGRKAIEPPGDARPDFWILNELARRVGVDWYYDHPREVFDEMRTCMDSIAGITWDRLERDSSVTYPCVQVGDPGDPVVFCDSFRTGGVRAGGPRHRGRAAGRRVPDGADHRAAARTLAHRIDDPPRLEPRLPRAGTGGVAAPARARSPERRARRDPDDRIAAR